MSKTEEKMLYRLKAQTDSTSITAQTKKEVTHKKAVEDMVNMVNKVLLNPVELYNRYIVEPICTEEEWKSGNINFCPRCGTNIRDYELGTWARTDCIECGAEFDVNISIYDEDED